MLGKTQAKYIQSLGQKKVRDQEGVYIAEGPKIVAELLATRPDDIVNVYALQNWIAGNEKTLDQSRLIAIAEHELAKISQLSTPNEVLAVVRKPDCRQPLEFKGRISLVLDTIQDPGNLGTIIRIADWFDIGQIICSPDCADAYNPKVVQSSMGSIFRMHMHYTNLEGILSQQKDIPILAATLDGVNIRNISPVKQGLIVIGNESKGISREIMNLVTEKITIPRVGKAESLNAAVATGIILSHLQG